jgi:hypothetical protein
MDVYFRSVALAALCNSERRLAERWGPVAGRALGRRLLEVGATASAHLDRLPRAQVSRTGRGETTIDFGDMAITGVVTSEGLDGETLVVTSIEVEGSVQR